jgi:hypothetical protein
MDAKACLERSDAIRPMSPELANNRADMTIVAATDDDVNRTPLPQTTSADRHLKHFTKRITKRRQPPLLELHRDETALADVHRPG